MIDFDADKNPISIEIQGASRRYPVEALTAISLEQPMALAQLASEYDLAEAHLRTLAIRGRLGAVKIGRNWTARTPLSWTSTRSVNGSTVEWVPRTIVAFESLNVIEGGP